MQKNLKNTNIKYTSFEHTKIFCEFCGLKKHLRLLAWGRVAAGGLPPDSFPDYASLHPGYKYSTIKKGRINRP
jgi:hypothetical protein